MPHLLAVCAVHQILPDPGQVGVTAIDKRAVDGPVKVGPYGLYADIQADRKNHGGLDKAVYIYSQEDAEHWERELGHRLAPGFFGENLRVSGIDVNAARIGEVWRIGEQVRLEVTMPRTPCQTFSRWVAARLGEEHARGWVKRFTVAGRVGPYLRVLERGTVQAGDQIVVEHRHDDAPTVLEVFRGE